MAESDTLLIWHIDYVDHVDEEMLCHSFEKFLKRIKFKILGVTKDKWGPATDAIKKVFHRLWIGFCHRHCLKKVRIALSKYQQESGCGGKKVKRFYKKLKTILETANSKVSLKIRIESFKDEVCKHPLIRPILNQIIEDGSRYTVCNRKRGIKKTTSVADNFQKMLSANCDRFRVLETRCAPVPCSGPWLTSETSCLLGLAPKTLIKALLCLPRVKHLIYPGLK